jgi:FMN phosphatase YigB (HAD superfamily)
MAVRCVILDFDGTFTDIETEAQSFVPVFRRELESRVGTNAIRRWERAERAVDQQPGAYGWESDGKIVAPATADPYVRATTIAQVVLKEAGFTDTAAAAAVIQEAYRVSYSATTTAFRAEAAAVLRILVNTIPVVCFVSNARPDVMEAKLRQLAPDLLESLRIFGDARKQSLDPTTASPRLSALPESVEIFGVSGRPVYLRRKHYFDILERIRRETGSSPQETLICGDVFELDLAMPGFLGYRVHLVCGVGTALRDIKAVRKFGNRSEVSNTLWGLAAHALQIPWRVRTRDGHTIRIPRGAREHLVVHPETALYLRPAAAALVGGAFADYLGGEVDLHRSVGVLGCIEAPRIRPDAQATFTVRPNRRAPSRVVISTTPQVTTKFTICAMRRGAADFELLTAYAGPYAPPEPWDAVGLQRANLDQAAALEYWCAHALVWQPSWPAPFESTWDEVLKQQAVSDVV